MTANSADDGFQCCFCGKGIEPVAPDPVQLVIPFQDGSSQHIFTHVACLRRLLHPLIQLHPFLWEED
jgi:hypothetical protein